MPNTNDAHPARPTPQPGPSDESATNSPLANADLSDATLPTYDADPEAAHPETAELFAAYHVDPSASVAWDEALFSDATARPHYACAAEKLTAIGMDELAVRQQRAEAMEEEEGITFRVSGQDKPRIFPMDFIPRIITADTWAYLCEGLEQRARALNAFLDDVYGAQRIVKAGIIDAEDITRAPGFMDEGYLQPPGSVRANICGMDLVCTDEGRWLVLEDNLRVPSGIVFSHFLRRIHTELFSDVMADYDMHDPSEGFAMLRETLLAALPSNAKNPQNPQLAVVSVGESDSAWFEHRRIAEFMDVPVCTPSDLAVIDGYLHYRDAQGETHPLDVVYARIEKDLLFAADGFDGKTLGPTLEDAVANRRLAFANAFGNGVGDDKAIYAHVPEMIRFYLGEEPLLDQVPTCLCHKPGEVDAVLERLDEVVVKPVDGYGGSGITIGPECSKEELTVRAEELKTNPEHFIAQDIVRLSTLPTYGPDVHGEVNIHPRHVDLRAFVHVRPASVGAAPTTDDSGTAAGVSAHDLTAHTVPAGLTRTAAAGSLIVNTSRGGGGKDTWILRAPIDHAEAAKQGSSEG